MRFGKTVVTSLIAISLAGMAAAEGVLISLKKDSVRGMKDGAMTSFTADDLKDQKGVIKATKKGPFYEITNGTTVYRVRVSDAIMVGAKRSCLAGENTVIAETTSIGATQMGSGTFECGDS